MRELLQVRFGEIHLKGQNRPYFMRMLVERVRNAVKDVQGHVWLNDSRVYVSDMTDMDEAIRRVTKVFGVHSVCRAVEVDKNDFEAVCAEGLKMLENHHGTFKVNARRSDKRYPMDSMTINMEMGGYILERRPDLKVDVKHPDVTLSVEIRDILLPKELQDVMSLEAQAEQRKKARIILMEAEQDICEMMDDMGDTYAKNDAALRLRAMHLLYESVRETGGTVVVPSSFSEGFGDVLGDAAKDVLGKGSGL